MGAKLSHILKSPKVKILDMHNIKMFKVTFSVIREKFLEDTVVVLHVCVVWRGMNLTSLGFTHVEILVSWQQIWMCGLSGKCR